jgi:hypothetical protein
LQLTDWVGTQVPVPLQAELAITAVFEPSQAGVGLQVIPAGAIAQAPVPLQYPSLPHGFCAFTGQSLRGSDIAGASVQVPVLLAQLRQEPEQSLWQQVPSKQNPVEHSAPLEQSAPAGFCPPPPPAPA